MKLIKVFVSFVMISLFVGLGNAFNNNAIPEVEESNYDKSTDVVETIKIPELELNANEDIQIADEKAIDNSFSESKKETSTTSKNDNQNGTKKESTSKKNNENTKNNQEKSVLVKEPNIVEKTQIESKIEEKEQEINVSINENNISNDFYNSITHGRYEDGIYTSKQCYDKGLSIQNKELDYVLDWNETHPNDIKSPLINNSICYEVIVNGQSRWYLHFKTTQGDEMDDYLKNLYS